MNGEGFATERLRLALRCATDRTRALSALLSMGLFGKKASAAPALSKPAADERAGLLRECPICFTLKSDVEVLPHLSTPDGNVESHCMCGECRQSFASFSCPFCRGKIGGSFVATSEIKSFVDGFVAQMCRDAKHGDQHKHAVWLEAWEAFEFQHGNYVSDTGVTHHEGRPDVVANVAALVMQDKRFAPLLEDGIERANKNGDGNTWLCNGSGVVFRLFGLLECGSLAVSPALAALLRRAYGSIFSNLARPGWHGAMLGCCYMQALSAWLSACRCGSGETSADAETVRRVGRAIAKTCTNDRGKADEVRKHTIESYVRLATSDVWCANDPVLKVAFR